MILSVKKFSQSHIDDNLDEQVSKVDSAGINETHIHAYNLALKLANEIIELVKIESNEPNSMFNSDYCYVSILINTESLWVTQLIVEVDAKDIEEFDNEMLYVLSCGNIHINYNIANETFINKGETYESKVN